MADKYNRSKLIIRPNKGDPPGKTKIANALRKLLETKDFSAITTADISKTSGINESLIYRYFESKRGLLHQVMEDYIRISNQIIERAVAEVEGTEEKLKAYIFNSILISDQNRVYAKIFLFEVRNFSGFFESPSYEFIKKYAGILNGIIEQGIEEGLFRRDIDAKYIRDLIAGAIEHYLMPNIIFKRKMDPDVYAENFYKIVFEGIANRDARNGGLC